LFIAGIAPIVETAEVQLKRKDTLKKQTHKLSKEN